MLALLDTPSPFLPITSLQLQHLQAVTHSFAQRRPVISPVFNNFRTLSVATGGGTLSGGLSARSELPVSALLCFILLPASVWGHFVAYRSFRAYQRGIAPRFLAEKQPRIQNPRTAAVPIQCCISPFNARKHHS